jgi:hypothetical protein
MKPASKTAVPSIDGAILSHIDAYGLTVVEAVERLEVFAGRPVGEAKRALARLAASGVISGADVYPGRTGYFPVLPPTSAKPSPPGGGACVAAPSRQSKIRRLAMLSFCCLGGMRRKPLTMVELESLAPTAHGLVISGPYYFQPAPTPLCGFLRVDMGGEGRWDRVLAKCTEDVRQHARLSAWRPLISAGRFEITLATALPQKAERLCRAFRDMSPPSAAPIRITVIPELLYVIAPPPE